MASRSTSRGRARAVAVTVAVASAPLLAAACGNGEHDRGQVGPDASGAASSATDVGDHERGHVGAANFSEAEADTVARVQLRDFGFFGLPETVKGPKVFFSAQNAGPAVHEMEITDAGGRVVAGIEPFPAGQSKTLAAELQPATYTVQCRVKEGARTHVDFGMVTTLTVE